MADKINGLSGSVHQPPTRQKPATEQGHGAPGQSAPVHREGDSVNLTDSAQRLSELVTRLSAADPVDQNRVEAVRQAIADGSYQVDAGRTAERLLTFDRMLEE
jgi:negative regulator of flagellin synthesis FlgM